MISLSNLAEKLADERDVLAADMLAIVEAYAGQINDDPDLYNAEAGELSDTGAEIITDQIAGAVWAEPSLLDELMAAQAEVDQQTERLSRRDAAVRKAMAEGVPVREIVEHTGLTRFRVYQIRDGRR